VLKSHVEAIVSIYEALFEDLTYALPQLKVDLQTDLDRLRRTARSRGITTFVVDLPLIGKHLDRCLAKGQLLPAVLPLMGKRKGSEYPKFLGGLYELIFGVDGSLKNDANVEAIIFLRQVFYLCKKVPLTFSETALRTSVRQLVEEDAVLPEPDGFWLENNPPTCMARVTFSGFSRSRYYRQKVCAEGNPSPAYAVLGCLDVVSKLLNASLGDYNPREWRFRHGPGAISQASGTVNKYHWYGWSEALESVYPIADHGFHNHASWAGSTLSIGLDDQYVPTSRLVAVPKTYEKPRLIAAEPSENQFCQQNLWRYFRTRSILGWIGDFVRFNDQSLNQSLCRKGSIDGKLCTIDLSSASDRVSCHAVGNFFRSNLGLLNALRATRTRMLKQRLDQSLPEVLNLKKFSTMGSACTFPVESLIFLGVALSSVLVKRELAPTLKNIKSLEGEVAVFGDDIIIPSDCRELCQITLESLDFKVNSDKSFSEGFFRESCGLDAYKGVDVTPIYLHELWPDTPESIVSLVDTANNFYSLFYLQVAKRIESTLPSSLMTVSVDSGILGFKSRVGTRFPRKRWNTALQRDEVRGLALSSTARTTSPEDDSLLLQYFTEAPSPYESWTAGVRENPHLKLKMRWVDISECVSSTDS